MSRAPIGSRARDRVRWLALSAGSVVVLVIAALLIEGPAGPFGLLHVLGMALAAAGTFGCLVVLVAAA